MNSDTLWGTIVMSRDIVDKPASQLLFVLGCRFLRSGGQCMGSPFRAAVPGRRKEHLRVTAEPFPSRALEGALSPKWPHFISTPLDCDLDGVQL